MYTPPSAEPDTQAFYDTFPASLEAHRLIMGGDFNTHLDPAIDRTPPAPNSQNRRGSSHRLRMITSAAFLTDVHRHFSSKGDQFTYSHRSSLMRSRLDLFWLYWIPPDLHMTITLLNLIGKYAPEGYGTATFATAFPMSKLKRKGGFWFNMLQMWRTLGGSPVASPKWTATEILSLPLYRCPLIIEIDGIRQIEEPKPPTPPYLLNEILTFVRWGRKIECRSLHKQALFEVNSGRQPEMERGLGKGTFLYQGCV
ncbi:uncharacterized protein VTP21DRAFT_9067 [Calcarisporiella thermophila]|uniref:uncharacterized protein n=1 Tax=Calcarisporiella thermophila TaxID=911321 RepID=UPI003742C89B